MYIRTDMHIRKMYAWKAQIPITQADLAHSDSHLNVCTYMLTNSTYTRTCVRSWYGRTRLNYIHTIHTYTSLACGAGHAWQMCSKSAYTCVCRNSHHKAHMRISHKLQHWWRSEFGRWRSEFDTHSIRDACLVQTSYPRTHLPLLSSGIDYRTGT